MSADVVQVLDPEIVNPSSESSQTLEFWVRMMAWAEIHDMKLGPSTLAALGDLIASPPVVRGLAMHDFWTIVGKYSSRAIAGTSENRPICETHIRANYSPVFGSPTNVDLLVNDLRVIGVKGRVALGTESRCWTLEGTQECHACVNSAISRIDSAADPDYSCQLADVWRRGFIADTPLRFDGLEELAPSMFPAIEFSSTAWNHLRSLSGEEHATAVEIVKHLGVLNDRAGEVWSNSSIASDREAALGALGVTASLEGPRTHKNRAAMKARDFDFSGGTIRCEWHTKLKPSTDRIYFAVAGGRVMVGTIVSHLPL